MRQWTRHCRPHRRWRNNNPKARCEQLLPSECVLHWRKSNQWAVNVPYAETDGYRMWLVPGSSQSISLTQDACSHSGRGSVADVRCLVLVRSMSIFAHNDGSPVGVYQLLSFGINGQLGALGPRSCGVARPHGSWTRSARARGSAYELRVRTSSIRHVCFVNAPSECAVEGCLLLAACCSLLNVVTS